MPGGCEVMVQGFVEHVGCAKRVEPELKVSTSGAQVLVPGLMVHAETWFATAAADPSQPATPKAAMTPILANLCINWLLPDLCRASVSPVPDHPAPAPQTRL